jgi:hypothetical protein
MRRTTILALGCLLSAGCADPVIDAEINALPDDGVRNGPTHRGGQPCLLCHSDEGGRNPAFSVAGTVYQKLTNKVPMEGVVVHVTDATGSSQDLTSNCAGNFYIDENTWTPTFPLWVSLSNPADGTTIKMISKAGRDGACAMCHADPAGAGSPGHVYLVKDATVPDAQAPVCDNGFGGR